MTDENILKELQKINKKLEVITHPVKYAGYSFLSGIFRSLGSLFGTAVIAALLIYFFSQLNLGEAINNYLQDLVSRLRFNVTNPF